MAVERWKASSLSCYIHPCHVMHGSKQANLVIHTPIGLHALKKLLGVVKHLKYVQRPVLHNSIKVLYIKVTLAAGWIFISFSGSIIG